MPQFVLWILAGICGILPAIVWTIIWYKKDSAQPEPKKMILLSFVFGMMGIIPIFGVQFMMEQSPTLLELWSLVQAKSFFLATIIFTLVLAGLEEFIKHFSVLRLGSKLEIYFDQIVDGIVYSVSAALGFSFMENILYFANALMFVGISSEFWSIFIFRSCGTMLGHALFSGIFGYFWGYAIFSKQICSKHTESISRNFFAIPKKIRETLKLHLIRNCVLRGRCEKHRRYEKVELVREAFLIATLTHTVFNLLLSSEIFGRNLTPLIAPLLVGGFVWLSHQFFVEKNVQVWKAV